MMDLPVAAPGVSETGGRNSVGFGVSCQAGQGIAQADERSNLYRLVDGWAFEARMLEDGRRQIVSFLLPGDPINATAMLGGKDGMPLYALTDLRLEALGDPDGTTALPAVLARVARLGEQVVNLGRRSAYERVSGFLLEIGERLDAVSGMVGQRYQVPLRLEHLADHLGLSVVHVSRTLRQLRDNGLATLYRGELELSNRAALAQISEYAGPRSGIAAP